MAVNIDELISYFCVFLIIYQTHKLNVKEELKIKLKHKYDTIIMYVFTPKK